MIRVCLLGIPSIQVDGQTVTLPYRKAEALLYYLTVNGRAARRDVVDLLWGDTDPSSALKNLRHAIYTIRKNLGPELLLPGQRTLLELNGAVDLSCDVLEFLDGGDLSLYRGEFLSGFTLPAEHAFEEWILAERSHLHTLYLKRLLAAEKAAFDAGDWERTERLGQACIDADPLEESAYVKLMEAYSRQKKFRKAISVYHRLCEKLESELGISPLSETASLYYRIVNEWNCSTFRAEAASHHPVVGKEAALNRLLSVCNSPLTKRKFPCVLLEGASGVGKTYLLDHVLTHYDFSDRLILRAFCYQSESASSLAPWNSIMLAIASEINARRLHVPDNCLEVAAGLFSCLALCLGRGRSRPDRNYPLQSNYHIALESSLLILSSVARQVPVLLIFEDIHWMDSASVQLLSAFLHRVRALNAAVICSCRELSDAPPYLSRFVDMAQRDMLLERCTIAPFTQEETAAFLRHYLGQELSQPQLEEIYGSTQGNALLLSQLANSLQSPGGLSAADIPLALKDILRYRLSQLPGDERQVLDYICTCVECVSADMLASMLETDDLTVIRLCGLLQQRRLICEATRSGVLCYTAAHDQIRTILLQLQSPEQRRFLHLHLARFLESRLPQFPAPPFDALIYHFEQGGNAFKALEYRIRFLNTYAGLCFDLLPTLPDRTDNLQLGGEDLFRYLQTLECSLRSLREFSPSPAELEELEAALLHVKSRCCIHNGLYAPGLAALERLTALCQAAVNTALLFGTHLQYIYYGIQTCDLAVMESHLDACRELLTGHEHTEDYGFYLRLRGLLLSMQGNYSDARAALERSIHLLSSLSGAGDARYSVSIAGAFNYLAETYRLQQRYGEALLYYDKAIFHNRSRGQYPGGAVFYTNRGICLFQKGDEAAAREMFQKALEIYDASHEFSGYSSALAYMALYQAREGNIQAAFDGIQRAHRICDTIGYPGEKGIIIYLCWEIRTRLGAESNQACRQLAALWPASEREHCTWGLSYLDKLPPTVESRILRRRLEELERDGQTPE